MPITARKAGVLREADNIYYRDSGVLRPTKKVWRRENGVLREVFNAAPSQTIQLPASIYTLGAWTFTNPLPALIPDISPSAANRFFHRISINSAGVCTVSVSASETTNSNADFSSAFEARGVFTLTSGTHSVTFKLSNADTSDDYVWTPVNSAELATFILALRNAGGSHAATLTMTLGNPNEQTIQLPGADFTLSVSRKSWERSPRVLIDSPFTAGDLARYFLRTQIHSDGRVAIQFTNTSDGHTVVNLDLSDAFEQEGVLTYTVGDNVLQVELGGADTSGPYLWRPSNSAEVIAFYNAIGNSNVAGALTIADGS